MCCLVLAGGLLSWLPRWRGLCVHRPRVLPGPAGGHLWGRQAVHTVQVLICLRLLLHAEGFRPDPAGPAQQDAVCLQAKPSHVPRTLMPSTQR